MTKLSNAKQFDSADADDAIALIKASASIIRLAQAQPGTDALSPAQSELSRAVRAANDLGISWQVIGEALGIARGNAYRRFRRKPGMETVSNRAAWLPAL